MLATWQNSRAELAYLIKKFDPAKLFHIEQAMEHSQSLIEGWLPKYKFKNWKTTKTGKKLVTPKMKRDRAHDIANKLGEAKRWHSHGRGISMLELRSSSIKLKINDFGKDKGLNDQIRHYHGLAVDYARKTGLNRFIHSKLGFRRI